MSKASVEFTSLLLFSFFVNSSKWFYYFLAVASLVMYLSKGGYRCSAKLANILADWTNFYTKFNWKKEMEPRFGEKLNCFSKLYSVVNTLNI